MVGWKNLPKGHFCKNFLQKDSTLFLPLRLRGGGKKEAIIQELDGEFYVTSKKVVRILIVLDNRRRKWHRDFTILSQIVCPPFSTFNPHFEVSHYLEWVCSARIIQNPVINLQNYENHDRLWGFPLFVEPVFLPYIFVFLNQKTVKT